jgi:hypothetical protein
MRCDLSGHDIFIQNTKLNRIGNDCDEKAVKFLGIYIDENLTWKYHLSNINKKISNALFAIKQVKKVLPYNCLKTLYYSLIHSHLSYGILAWGNAAQSNLQHTIILQKRALRIIHNAKFNSHTDPLFQHSRVLKLHDIYEYQSVLFIFDLINGKLPPSFDTVFTFNKDIPNARSTRQSHQLHIIQCKSLFAHKLPLYELPKMWNKWEKFIDQSGSRSMCKRQLKIKIFDSYPTRVKCTNPHCKDYHP